jgi:DNA-binding transcriptional LysR family regulator
LTVALSDTYQSDRFEAALSAFEQRYPDLELECLIAECDDLVALVQSGRAQVAFAEMQDSYPPDLVSSTVDERTDIALFASLNIRWQRCHTLIRTCYSSTVNCAWQPSSIPMKAGPKGASGRRQVI